MTLKDHLHRIVDELPENERALEEMHTRLLMLQQVQKGVAQLDRGEGISHEQVAERMKKWRQE